MLLSQGEWSYFPFIQSNFLLFSIVSIMCYKTFAWLPNDVLIFLVSPWLSSSLSSLVLCPLKVPQPDSTSIVWTNRDCLLPFGTSLALRQASKTFSCFVSKWCTIMYYVVVPWYYWTHSKPLRFVYAQKALLPIHSQTITHWFIEIHPQGQRKGIKSRNAHIVPPTFT